MSLIGVTLAKDGPWGHYVGHVKIELGGNGRDATLLENFVYIDPKGHTWGAPAGWKIDGASIPRPFWSIIGGPFEGKYRDASVIHDVACDQRNMAWKEVHQMFYNAMRCSGTEERQAKIMYYAVYHFGPRWGLGPAINSFFATEKEPSAEDVERVKDWVKRKNPNLKEIENAKSEALPTR